MLQRSELEARLKQFLTEVFDPALPRPIRRERRRALGFAEGYARALVDAGLLTPESLRGHLEKARYAQAQSGGEDPTAID